MRSRRVPGWLAPAILLVGAFTVYALTSWDRPVSFDVYSANLASWRITRTGAPWFDGVPLVGLDESPIRWVWVVEAANGHTVIGRTPGVVAAGLPGYWLMGTETFTPLPGALTASLLTAVTLVIMFATWVAAMGRARTTLAVATFGFATPVWSVAANGIWPHTITVFGIAGMAWASNAKRWWLVGVFGGVALWGRLHVAVIVAILGLWLAWKQRDPSIAARIGVMSGLFLALTCVWCQWMYGSWSPTSSYDTSNFAGYAVDHRFDVVNQLGLWVSPDRGLLVWTPLLLLLLPALIRSWSRQPDWTKALLAGGLVYTFIQGALNRFSGGDQYYGYRLTLELLACAFPALIVASRSMGRTALALAPAVIAIQMVAIMQGAVHDNAYVVDSNDAWTQNGFALAVSSDPRSTLGLSVLFVVLALLVARVARMRERARQADDPAAGDPDRYERLDLDHIGTDSSHSVP